MYTVKHLLLNNHVLNCIGLGICCLRTAYRVGAGNYALLLQRRDERKIAPPGRRDQRSDSRTSAAARVAVGRCVALIERVTAT